MPNQNSIDVSEAVDAIELIEPPAAIISKPTYMDDDEVNAPMEDTSEPAKRRSSVRTLSIMAALFVSILNFPLHPYTLAATSLSPRLVLVLRFKPHGSP